MKKLKSITSLIIALFLFSCSEKNVKNYQEFEKEGVKHIENSRKEAVSDFDFSIKSIFEVKNDDADTSYTITFPDDRYDLAADLDHNQNLFVVDYKRRKILKFDNKGNYIKNFGNRGSGPGEFPSAPVDLAVVSDSLYIVGSNGRLSIFDLDGKFSRYYETNKRCFGLNATREGLVVLVEDYEGRWKTNDFKMGFCLYNLNNKMIPAGKIYGELKPFDIEKIDSDDQGIRYFTDRTTNIITVAKHSKDEFRLFQYNYQGTLVRDIKKKYNPLKREKEVLADYEKALTDFTKKSGGMVKFKKVSQYKNAIDQIFQDKDKHIWVSVNESKLSEKPQEFDIFDPQGHYLKRISSSELAGLDLRSKGDYIVALTPKEVNYSEDGMADLEIKVVQIGSK